MDFASITRPTQLTVDQYLEIVDMKRLDVAYLSTTGYVGNHKERYTVLIAVDKDGNDRYCITPSKIFKELSLPSVRFDPRNKVLIECLELQKIEALDILNSGV